MADETRGTLEERLVLNEALERELNAHHVRSARENGEGGSPAKSLLLACECSILLCGGQIEVTAEEWNEVRSNPHRFLIAVGHDVGRDGEVVSRRDDFWVVAKCGEDAQRIAERTDPRNSPYL